MVTHEYPLKGYRYRCVEPRLVTYYSFGKVYKCNETYYLNSNFNNHTIRWDQDNTERFQEFFKLVGNKRKSMIKIIENPNPVKEEIQVCDKCKCKFSYTQGDIKIDSWDNGILGPGYYGYKKEYIYCPNCGESITISSEDSNSNRREDWIGIEDLDLLRPHLYKEDEDEEDIVEIINNGDKSPNSIKGKNNE